MSSEPEQQPEPTEEESGGASAPPEPGEATAGETSFADADAAPAEDAPAEEPSASVEDDVASLDGPEPAADEARRYLALAQRTQADFENFRRRATRDAAAASNRGKTALAREILPALDHLDLALSAAEQDVAAAEFAKGVRLVQDELLKALGRAGIEAYSPLDEPFDPSQHEAMAAQPTEGAESGQVVQVYQPGYRLGDAVLRPARVVVAA